MKISEAWLREWLDLADGSQIDTAQLTMAGLEVETVSPACDAFCGVLVGQVQEIFNVTDKKFCRLDLGGAEKNRVVALVAEDTTVQKGDRVAVAPESAKIAGRVIHVQDVAGQVINAELCLESDLGISEEKCLWSMPETLVLGDDVRQVFALEDQIIDIDLTPNRGDCASALGLARELAVIHQCDFKGPILSKQPAEMQQVQGITIKEKEACPRYLGQMIQGIRADASCPTWMLERLRRSGLRSVSVIVDILNYVMLELGQPMHAFDASVIQGGIIVRYAQQGEKLTLLNDQEVQLEENTLIIADRVQPLAIAGVMGGSASAVTLNTQDVFIECAFFSPQQIRGAARAYSLQTDSSYRFERGVDFALQEKALLRAVNLITEIAGGRVGPVVSESGFFPEREKIVLRRQRIKTVLGFAISDARVEQIMRQLMAKVESASEGWLITVPTYRFDVSLEEDLIEELVRIEGYQNIPSEAYAADMKMTDFGEKSKAPLQVVKHFLVAQGYHECMTYSFVDPSIQRFFDESQSAIALANPLSPEMSYLRTTLWSSLIVALLHNQRRQQQRIRLFESGMRFFRNESGDIEQTHCLAGMVVGRLAPENWTMPERAVDFFDIKGDVEGLLSMTRQSSKFAFKAIEDVALHPGRSAGLYRDDILVGRLGQLHPSLCQSLGVKGEVYVFELDLEPILARHLPIFQPISKYPAVRRDFALVVDQTVPAQALLDMVEKTLDKVLAGVDIFDVYEGQSIDSGRKSLALALTLQDPSRTLTDAEVNKYTAKVVTALKDSFGATMRE